MTLLGYEATIATLTRVGVPREKAEQRARELYPDVAAQLDVQAVRRADVLEKAIVAGADKYMRALAFTVWNLSQPRASKIAAGIPDRLYTSPARGLALYWEAKSARGRQRPDQRLFQEHCEACGLHYVLGTDAVLYAWLSARGIQLSEG